MWKSDRGYKTCGCEEYVIVGGNWRGSGVAWAKWSWQDDNVELYDRRDRTNGWHGMLA